MAKVDIGRISFLKSSHDVFEAASYSKGGKNTKNTISGFKDISGMNGIKPSTTPTINNSIGYGNFIFPEKMESTNRMAIIKITVLKFSITTQIVSCKNTTLQLC